MDYRDLKNCQPHLGNNVDICGTLRHPRLRWRCNPNELYTILFIDIYPYGISRKKLGAYGIEWLVVNVPGCHVSKGKTLYEYQAPLPLKGAGQSRYAVLVYRQPAWTIDWSEEPIVSSM